MGLYIIKEHFLSTYKLWHSRQNRIFRVFLCQNITFQRGSKYVLKNKYWNELVVLCKIFMDILWVFCGFSGDFARFWLGNSFETSFPVICPWKSIKSQNLIKIEKWNVSVDMKKVRMIIKAKERLWKSEKTLKRKKKHSSENN